MDNHTDPLSQIDAEIEKLRQQKPEDAADPKCAEIDAGITAWQWARENMLTAPAGTGLSAVLVTERNSSMSKR